MPLTPEQMGAAIIANMEKKTGRTMTQWIEIVKAFGPENKIEIVAWLKREYDLGHVTAQLIASRAIRPDSYTPPTPQELLDSQYSGPKAVLLPIYEKVVAAAIEIGDDIRIEPRLSYVSLIRKSQFGLIQASTRTRVDLGLKLPGVTPTHRLQAAGTFGSGQMSHRVALTSPEQIDAELIGWLRQAYIIAG